MAQAQDLRKSGTVSVPEAWDDEVDTSTTRNIDMKQHLSVKHALPKTRLTNTILYENSSHDRHLALQLASIERRKERTMFSLDMSRRTFVKEQEKKRRQWMREDEMRLSGLNLPVLPPAVVERCPSVQILCHCRFNNAKSGNSPRRQPILPMLKIRKERTDIVLHRNKTFITHLPTFVTVDRQIEAVFDLYRGKTYLDRDFPSHDVRFRRLLEGQEKRKQQKENLWRSLL
ncbi:uncharacterized protein LOC131947982 [Physella acuta]|uniref:uncharacterized protein LOC131947982 n=1 Tax=Physella acuta TaxID=109671 RepID=UPI0027DB4922|nr:uncharacterized protein LOC131947982 [Physella acuta]XP_059165403.1 uncharacterized protein LOC131947982 [Physella acuta]